MLFSDQTDKIFINPTNVTREFPVDIQVGMKEKQEVIIWSDRNQHDNNVLESGSLPSQDVRRWSSKTHQARNQNWAAIHSVSLYLLFPVWPVN